MSRVSKVDARLVAKMSANQVWMLGRLERLNKAIETIFRDAAKSLAQVVIGNYDPEPRYDYRRHFVGTPFDSVFAKAFRRLVDGIEGSFETLAKEHHSLTADAIIRSVPKEVWFHLLPITEEWVEYEEPLPGRIVFDGGMVSFELEDRGGPFGVPTKKLRAKKLNDNDKLEAAKQVYFPPPTELQVKNILARKMVDEDGPGETNGLTWRDRIEKLSGLVEDKRAVFNEISQGYSRGENLKELQARIEPQITGGIKASAARVARTEGMRIAEQVQRKAWDGIWDMMTGVQIVAVLDTRTQPKHATRNGTIYYKTPRPNLPTIAQLPDLPDAPNCRCMTVPVMEPPEELKNDPAVREAFKLQRESGTAEPRTYDRWFKNASTAERKTVVGVNRYDEVGELLGRIPQWTDFIDDRGRLIPLENLLAETSVEREERKQRLERKFKTRRRKLRDVSGRGFELPRAAPRKSSLSPLPSKGNPTIANDSSQLRRELSRTMPGATPLKIAAAAGAPPQSVVDIRLTRSAKRSTIDINIQYDGEVSVRSRRYMRIDASGERRLINFSQTIIPNRTKAGFDIFQRQIFEARKLGFDTIELTAVVGPFHNGAITWAKFGFDAPIPDSLLQEARKAVPNAKRIIDLMRTRRGQAFWELNAVDYDGVFDLRPRSKSRLRLNTYRRQKLRERERTDENRTESAEQEDPIINRTPLSEVLREMGVERGPDDIEQPPIADDDPDQFLLSQIWIEASDADEDPRDRKA